MTRSPAPALSRGLEIVEVLAGEQRPLGFNELMERMQLNPSSLNRYLTVLVEKGYVVKDGQGQTGYTLGLHLLALSHGDAFWDRLHHAASPILHETTAKFRVTSILIGFSGRRMVILDKVLCPDNVAGQEIGEVKTDYLWVPWGAIFLAHMPEDERAYMLEHMELAYNRMGRPVTHNELIERMDMVRSRGYIDDMGLQIPQIRRIAAPVYRPNNQLTAALAAVSMEIFLEEVSTERLITWLKRQAAQLSNLLQAGY